MSLACGIPLLECIPLLACARWAWKRCTRNAGHDSENWSLATAEEFEPVPRLCRYILANYEDDLEHPQWEPPRGYGVNPQWILSRKTYNDTHGHVSPYLLYVDHKHSDIVLAIRGLNLAKESDYAVLLDNRLGKRKIDGGYVHNGLLKAAAWVLDAECNLLKGLLAKYPKYTLTFAGHSLGSGVAAMLAMLVVLNREKLGDIDRKRIRCYAIAPARCMSLNLADDFLPRTATPLEDIFKSILCSLSNSLPCLLCLRCMRDTFIPEHVLLRDQRRLYAPGRLYHIVERKPFRCGRYPPAVKTGIPVDGRFEHILLSCNATSDHAIIWIERESQWALDLMLEKEPTMEIPARQRMERKESLAREHSEEHKAALRRAVTLSVPDAYHPSAYGTFESNSSPAKEDSSASKARQRLTWNDLIEKLFEKDESGQTFISRMATNE
ncbi:hypothetical protein AXF42_Ash002010 [Apostasia shenzhenica]|uniref:Uncharacterized protein n=1 Tax=Apostasia shenzhenica TaxID=1088818 RepID=A0A2I0ABW1_9ASPA|nr:hypothetical protein AXF42_Ash002010 [Apostasia shenzhenica]